MAGEITVGGNILASHTGIDGAGSLTLGNTVAPASSYMFRNRIINGAMTLNQRNAGSSVTPADSQYTLDRYIYYATQGSKFTVEQKEGLDTTASNYEANSTPDGFKNSLKLTATAYALQPSDYFLINQRIEGLNVLDFNFGTLSAKTLTLSFYVKSTGLTHPVTLGGAISNGAFDRSYPFEYQVQSSNTWERITITITGDTSGTWVKTNGTGLIITFSLGVGSSKQGTANTWGSQAFSTSNEEPIIETNGATLYITGVQLEEGTVATPFEHRPYGLELSLCQRYYQQMWLSCISRDYNRRAHIFQNFTPNMRIKPTAKVYSAQTETLNKVSGYSSGIEYTIENINFFQGSIGGTEEGVPVVMSYVQCPTGSSFPTEPLWGKFTFDAEL